MALTRTTVDYLQKYDGLAADSSQEPGLGHVLDERGRQTHQDDHEVAHCQVHDEHVGHSPHVLVPQHGEADQPIADQPDDEGDQIREDESPFIVLWCHMLIKVVIVRGFVPAVLVPTGSTVIVRVRCGVLWRNCTPISICAICFRVSECCVYVHGRYLVRYSIRKVVITK